MKKIIILILFSAVSQIWAQEQLTLEKAVNIALNNNDGIKRYEEKFKQKKYDNLAAWGNFLPSVSIEGRYTHLNDQLDFSLSPIRDAMIAIQSSNQAELANIYNILGTGVPLSDQQKTGVKSQAAAALSNQLPPFETVFKDRDYRTATITGIQPLFTGGKLIAAKKYAAAEKSSASNELTKVRDEIINETVKNYLNVVFLQEVVKLREEVIEGIKEHVTDAEKLYGEGVIAAYEVLRAKVALSDAERNLISDRNNLKLAKEALYTTLNAGGEKNFSIAGRLAYSGFGGELEKYTGLAKKNNPVLKMLADKKRAASQKFNLERSKLMPTIAAFGKYETIPEDLSALEPKWAVGVQASLNIFNGFKDVLGMQAATALEDEVDYLLKNTEDKIALLTAKNYYEAESRQEMYARFDDDIRLAEENLRMSIKRFEAGTGSSLEVTDARLTLEKTNVERSKTLYEYYKSLADLYTAAGITDEFFEIWNKAENVK